MQSIVADGKHLHERQCAQLQEINRWRWHIELVPGFSISCFHLVFASARQSINIPLDFISYSVLVRPFVLKRNSYQIAQRIIIFLL